MKSRSSSSQPARALAPALSQLADLFARFRREHPRGARVPRDLRAAALAALESGVTHGDLYRSCGVSWSQVIAWKGSDSQATAAASTGPKLDQPKAQTARRRSRQRHGGAKDVRVFTVAEPAGELAPGHELELRLGAWSVSVRLADHGERK